MPPSIKRKEKEASQVHKGDQKAESRASAHVFLHVTPITTTEAFKKASLEGAETGGTKERESKEIFITTALIQQQHTPNAATPPYPTPARADARYLPAHPSAPHLVVLWSPAEALERTLSQTGVAVPVALHQRTPQLSRTTWQHCCLVYSVLTGCWPSSHSRQFCQVHK